MRLTDLPGTATDRARFRAAIAETHTRGEKLLEEFRGQREHHVLMAESLAVEGRILREDLSYLPGSA